MIHLLSSIYPALPSGQSFPLSLPCTIRHFYQFSPQQHNITFVIQGDLQPSVLSILKDICSHFVDFQVRHGVRNVTRQPRHISPLTLFDNRQTVYGNLREIREGHKRNGEACQRVSNTERWRNAAHIVPPSGSLMVAIILSAKNIWKNEISDRHYCVKCIIAHILKSTSTTLHIRTV